jgi:hypothetical protein
MANKVNAYWKNVLTIVPIIGAAVATIIYLLRLYCRRMKALGFLLEDYLMGVGLIISYCATAFVIDSEHSSPSSRRDTNYPKLPSMASVCRSHHSPNMNVCAFNLYVLTYW